MTNLRNSEAAAISTVSGVNMTTRKQMLKIKVNVCLSVTTGIVTYTIVDARQGMSEAKVEKIKVRSIFRHICALAPLPDTLVGSGTQNNCVTISPFYYLDPVVNLKSGILLCDRPRAPGKAQTSLDNQHWEQSRRCHAGR
jgi:hypothetical protein